VDEEAMLDEASDEETEDEEEGKLEEASEDETEADSELKDGKEEEESTEALDSPQLVIIILATSINKIFLKDFFCIFRSPLFSF